jgi:hypothetical protein
MQSERDKRPSRRIAYWLTALVCVATAVGCKARRDPSAVAGNALDAALEPTEARCAALQESDPAHHPFVAAKAREQGFSLPPRTGEDERKYLAAIKALSDLATESPRPWSETVRAFSSWGYDGILSLPELEFYFAIYGSEKDDGAHLVSIARLVRGCIERKFAALGVPEPADGDPTPVVAVAGWRGVNAANSEIVNTLTDPQHPFRVAFDAFFGRASKGETARAEYARVRTLLDRYRSVSQALGSRIGKMRGTSEAARRLIEAGRALEAWGGARRFALAFLVETDVMTFNGDRGKPALVASDRDGARQVVFDASGESFMADAMWGVVAFVDTGRRPAAKVP